MQKKDSWLLPQGIDEVLPENAKQLEALRRQLLDVFACWGYELVIPPVVDFLTAECFIFQTNLFAPADVFKLASGNVASRFKAILEGVLSD